jgi:hypothetical protein
LFTPQFDGRNGRREERRMGMRIEGAGDWRRKKKGRKKGNGEKG